MSEADPTHNGKLAKALLAAQKEMPAVEPDGINPHYKSRFVTLGHLIAKARPVINKHGIAAAQFPSADDAGKPTLVTILMHESGERLQFAAPLLLAKQDPQGQGSAITYMRRYALAAALGISDQEDDDGNAASPPASSNSVSEGSDVPSAKQLDFIASLAKDLGADGADQELLRAYAATNLTGGREGTGSREIAGLKGDTSLDPAEALVRFLAKAAAWAEKRDAVPADTSDLEPAA